MNDTINQKTKSKGKQKQQKKKKTQPFFLKLHCHVFYDSNEILMSK